MIDRLQNLTLIPCKSYIQLVYASGFLSFSSLNVSEDTSKLATLSKRKLRQSFLASHQLTNNQTGPKNIKAKGLSVGWPR